MSNVSYARHKRDGLLKIITREYVHKYKEYMYLLENGLWYFKSDLEIKSQKN